MTGRSMQHLLSVWLVLSAIFLLSVFARFSLVNKAISNYDHCDFFLLTTFENWNERGVADCHFSPILTYNNPGDKHVASYKRLESVSGDNYFVSFPPFSFLFAYAVFKAIHIAPGKLAIQVLNIALHFISAFFIYLLVFNYYNKNTSLKLFMPALVAFVVYLFIPIVMYMHTVVYFPETFGQVLWIIAFYLTFSWFNSSVENKHRAGYLLSLSIFFMTYSEWIGIFYATILLILVKRSDVIEKSDKSFITKSIFISSASAVLLTLIQYSSINGIKALAKAFVVRYAERSGLLDSTHSDLGFNFFSAVSYLRFMTNLNAVLFPFGYLLIVLVIIIGFIKGYPYLWQTIKKHKMLVVLATMPGIIHLFVFFNSSVIHSHCVAVLGVGIAVFLGCITCRIYSVATGKKIILNILVVFILCTSIAAAKLNFDHSHAAHNDYSFLTQTADFIKQDAQKDEAVFLNIKTELSNSLNYISFMSKRNMLNIKDTVEAKWELQKLNKTKAVFYQFDSQAKAPFVCRFSIH
jgi:hypothetical protein